MQPSQPPRPRRIVGRISKVHFARPPERKSNEEGKKEEEEEKQVGVVVAAAEKIGRGCGGISRSRPPQSVRNSDENEEDAREIHTKRLETKTTRIQTRRLPNKSELDGFSLFRGVV